MISQKTIEEGKLILQSINGILIILIIWMIIEGFIYCWNNYSKYNSAKNEA